MNILTTPFFIVSIISFFAALFPTSSLCAQDGPLLVKLVDTRATKQTQALYTNLHKIKEKGILFGHQDDLAYGVHWTEEKGRSDVKEVCNSYPAVYGWEIAKLGIKSHNLDSVNFNKMRRWIKEGYQRGGLMTLSWHMDNPKTGGDAWDTTGAIKDILPGGEKHLFYKKRLDAVARFMNSLKSKWLFGHPIPIIFRPFHEHTGSWFWWGVPNNTAEDYKALWRFTVRYLRDTKQVHHLLYAYSPDIIESKAHYLECYPGDDYVDILGLDDYHDVASIERLPDLTRRLKMVVELADEKGKVAALTETGFETIPESDWWTDMLLRHIKNDPIAQRIAWLMVWRNDRLDHHYAPFKGHSSATNFIEFRKDPITIFEDDLPAMYRY